MPPAYYIVFLFALGASIGSFLNVVVWRLPRGESLSTPPSHCPKCDEKLRWYDNIPILGWIKLGGKCRFCKQPISIRYPIVEAVTALLFVFYYVMYYLVEVGPCPPVLTPFFPGASGGRFSPPEAPVFLLHLFLISALLVASLIDAEKLLIPMSIPWTVVAVAVVVHTLFDRVTDGGAVNAVRPNGALSPVAAIGAGGSVGLLISLLLSWRGVLRPSFREGEPLLEVDREQLAEEIAQAKHRNEPAPLLPPEYTPGQIRREMRHEMAFLLPPLALAILWWVLTERVPAVRTMWQQAGSSDHVTGLLGSLFGGLVGAFVVWLFRILGTLGFGRVAMGLGDVDLMFAVGTVVGAGAATVAFFLAPFFAILTAVWLFLSGSKREMPFGPYLSMASAMVMLCYCPIEQWLAPGVSGLGYMLRGLAGG